MGSVGNLPGNPPTPSTPLASPAAAHDGPSVQPATPERDRDPRSRSHAGAQALAVPAQAASASAPAPLCRCCWVGWPCWAGLGFRPSNWRLSARPCKPLTHHSSKRWTTRPSCVHLDTLAADTQRLADSGNPNARALVDELKKRGVTISTTPANAAPATAAPTAPAAR